jgi:hypothetical protein
MSGVPTQPGGPTLQPGVQAALDELPGDYNSRGIDGSDQ